MSHVTLVLLVGLLCCIDFRETAEELMYIYKCQETSTVESQCPHIRHVSEP